MDMDLRAGLYWRAFVNDEEFPNGLTFRKALKQAQLDFSLKSLGRLDQLLNQIHQQRQPKADEFLRVPANQEFVFLLGFYVGMLVAKQSYAPIKWLNYDELSKLYPDAGKDYPPCFATTFTCLIGRDRLFVPLAGVVERLFNPVPERTVRNTSERYIIPPPANLTFRKPAIIPANDSFAATMQVAGFLSAQMMWNVAEGDPIIPTTCTHFADGKDNVKTLMMETFEAALAAGRADMDKNPDGGVSMILVFDAMLKLADGPSSAMIIEVRSYPPQAKKMIMALPYKQKVSPTGFAVHQIKIIEASFSEQEFDGLLDHFFLGVQSNSIGAQVWAKSLDESV